jgi:NAD+ kinase
MAGKIKTIAMITKADSKEAEEAAARIARILGPKNVVAYTVEPLVIIDSQQVKLEDLRRLDLDLAFAVGGDGTTLRAFRFIPYRTPLFSINVGGNRGVLSEKGITSLDESINSLLLGKYFRESRIRIQVSTNNLTFPAALNDIMLTRTNLTRTPMLSIKLLDDVIEHRMDGIIISTPTGSTGHSFSVGGPVLYEKLETLLLCPIAPLNKMPNLVLPLEKVEIESSHDMSLVIDGQEVFNIAGRERLIINRHPHDAEFIRIRKRGIRQFDRLGF